MAIKKLIKIKGTMTALEGIHVGGNNEGTKVGGCDNPVIKNPLTGYPYIPGSTIKGCMRSITERSESYNVKSFNGMPCGCGKADCIVCKMFGPHKNTNHQAGEPRIIFRDMQINKAFEDGLYSDNKSLNDIIEIKASTMVDRVTNTAKGGSLRNIERIVAGTVFDCEFVLKILTGDNEDELINCLKDMIKTVEIMGIGSKTSSGSGEVKFDINWDKVETIKM